MGILAAHLNDAAILVADDERILYREPGFALLEDDRLTTGNEAYSNARLKPRRIQNHYWSELQAEALADPRFQHISTADLVSRQLEQVWKAVAKPGDRLAIAVPAYMDNDNLGLLLGIAMELDIAVVAMVDAAVAATRRHYERAVPVHIDLSLHVATLTRLMQEGQAQVERSAIVDDCGLLTLYDNWLRIIAESFVQQSRFDPLHTAETEQVLQNSISDWLSVAASADSVPMEIEYRGIAHRAELESLELIAAAAPVYQNIVSNLRALYRAEDTPAIQLSDRAARMPGLAETLKTRVGGEVFLLEPGATARGLLRRCRETRGDGGLTLVRHLPWDQAPVEVRVSEAASRGGQPTHLLFGNHAHAVSTDPLVLGSQPADSERWLDLQQEMPGVSRRHCVVSQENGQCVVTDYSRYGTFLNGHRIDGSAVLQTGDLLRVGTPGFELRLISAEDRYGT
ncbi:MAG: FHA domain-containing protein [Gammaproteobacteria bacterium]|nr:FHA domain-containing protein [Gammaproteobacteria bacterium]